MNVVPTEKGPITLNKKGRFIAESAFLVAVIVSGELFFTSFGAGQASQASAEKKHGGWLWHGDLTSANIISTAYGYVQNFIVEFRSAKPGYLHVIVGVVGATGEIGVVPA